MHPGRSVCAAALMLFMSLAPAWAQSATATLGGVVVDETNAVLPDVAVSVLAKATGLQRENKTNQDGQFSFPALQPGRYVVRATRQGFTPVEAPDVILNVNDNISIRLQLKVEGIGEQVTVEAAPSTITTSAAVGTVIDRQFVGNLPLNGRTFQSLIALTPGVVFGVSVDTSPGQFSVNGQRTNANYFTIDGVSGNAGVITNPNFAFSPGQEAAGTTPALNAIGGTQGLIAVDALEEFKIQTSTYSAEFGRQPGGQITLVSRAGTNAFQGTAFNYFRDDSLDATDWFTTASRLPKARLHQNQFGGFLGGPVRLPGYDGRGRSFFFVAYEGLDLTLPRTMAIDVPSRAIRQNAAPLARAIVDIFPLPTGPDDPITQRARFEAAYSDLNTAHSTSVRIDHSVGYGTRFFGRYNYAPSSSVTRVSSSRLETHPLLTAFTGGATQVLGQRATHDVRVNYTGNEAPTATILDTFGGAIPIDPATVLPPGTPFPEAGFFQFVTYTGGIGLWSGKTHQQRQFNVVDTVTWTRDAHALKFGMDYREMRPSYQPFGYLLSLQLSTPAAVTSGVLTNAVIRQQDRADMRYQNFSAYAQDTYRLSRRATIDLGLRWDLNPAPRAMNGRDFYTVKGVESLATIDLAPAGTPLYPTRYNGVAPRIGASVLVSDRSGWETTVRSGFGLYYDIGAGVAGRAADYYPFQRQRIVSNTPLPLTAITGAAPAPVSADPPYVGQTFIAFPDYAQPRTWQWNAAVDQALGPSQRVSITYVGAAGRHLLVRESVLNPNARFTGNSTIDISRGTGESSYRALQLQYQRRLFKGLQALAGYTLAKADDVVSSDSVTLPRTDFVDVDENRGPADFDIRHVFTASATWIAPTPAQPVLAAILGHWSFDAIVRAQSAPPVDVTVMRTFTFGTYLVRPDVNAAAAQYLSDPSLPGGMGFNPAAFAVSPEIRQGTLSRNALRGFPFRQIDFSLNRDVAVTRTLKLQIRCDIFNLFNTPNFASPDSLFATASGTVVTPRSTFGRSTSLLYGRLGGLNRQYQVGGPRSIQLSARIAF